VYGYTAACILYANYVLPSNLPRGFQRVGFENHFRAGGFSDIGYGLGLLMVKSSPGVNLKPRFGPILDSTVCSIEDMNKG